MTEVSRTFDILNLYKTIFAGKSDALAGKEKGQWKKYSSEDYVRMTDALSIGLLDRNIAVGDKVVTISNNRPEWNFIDMAIAQTGAIHVPLFTTLTDANYHQILSECSPTMIIVSDKALAEKITAVCSTLEVLPAIFTIDDVEGQNHWKKLLPENDETASKEKLESIKAKISADDCVTLIYTSGTTGNSKGVMLSHRNLLSTSKAASEIFQLQPEHRYFSILPICHVGERMGCYQSQLSGCSIYYGENLATIAADLQDIKPHGFGAVPRILEKVYEKILSKGKKLSGVKKKLFYWALDLGLRYQINGKNGWVYELQLSIANKLIFSKWRAAMGENVISIGIGGAALPPHLERVFWAAGIKLLNMYGLTETSPIITINRATSPLLKLGSVGKAIEGVEVKIAEDGEILCKGPNVMLGYYNQPELTRDVLKDGWFNTGDIGHLDEDGFLHITDRKKELFKLSSGKYVSPQVVENRFKESIYIDQLMVIGEGEKFASALISPNFASLRDWCSDKSISGNTKELIAHPEVKELFQQIVKEVNPSLDKDEQLSRIQLVPDEWTPDSGELSPTLKLKRKVIAEKYADIIAKIF